MWASPSVSLRSDSPPVQIPQVRPTSPPLPQLAGLTLLAVLVHGYHYGIEDQAIYLPAILRKLHPTLFPRGAQFFESQTRFMLLDSVIAWASRATHLPLSPILLALHMLTVFLLLLACWRIAQRCFPTGPGIWGGIAVLACMLTLPIAGTSQYIVDQYLHPRALATAIVLIPVADLLPGARRLSLRTAAWCGLWVAASMVVHAQMALFGLALCVFLAIPVRRKRNVLQFTRPAAAACLLPYFLAVSPEWLEAARTRSQHYLLRWEWYELLGIVAPMLVLWWFARIAEKRGLFAAAWLARRVALFGAVSLVLGAMVILPPQFERLTPLQPMRVFILVYVFLLVLGGGLLGQLVLRRVPWRWLVLFLPMALGMFVVQRELFPASPHLEFPGVAMRNDWTDAFLWVRSHTPEDAYFALNPHYLSEDGEDFHGFRAWAQRSQMADLDKDPGAVSLFPSLAPEWKREVDALVNWNTLNSKDLASLQREFGVNWVILERQLSSRQERPIPENLTCPYQNESVDVCTLR